MCTSLHSHCSSFVPACLPFFLHTIIIVPPGLARKYMWNCFCILLRQNKANQNHWGSHTWYSNTPLPPFILCQAPFVLCFINLKGQKSKKSVAKETCQTIFFHERLSWRFLLISSDQKRCCSRFYPPPEVRAWLLCAQSLSSDLPPSLYYLCPSELLGVFFCLASVTVVELLLNQCLETDLSQNPEQDFCFRFKVWKPIMFGTPEMIIQ